MPLFSGSSNENDPGPGPEIWIVLSTCNAGTHLSPQIDSILDQSHANWRLLIRDDGSTDGTIQSITRYAQSDPRVLMHEDVVPVCMGTRASYSKLIQNALARGAEWIALADQDDVWMPDKLARQVAALVARPSSPDEPRLLHTDLRVVDRRLEPISESFLSYAGIEHVDADPLRTLLIQNFVTGCTCVLSRGLAERAVPVPDAAIMHDWWIALNAAAWGEIEFLPFRGTDYRQHAENQIGAKGYRQSIVALIRRTFTMRESGIDELYQVVIQARAFSDHLRQSNGSPSIECEGQAKVARELTEEFVSLFEPSVSRFDRVRGLMRLGIARQDLIRDFTLKLKLLTSSFPVIPK